MLKLHTAPTLLPLTTAEVKLHLRVDSTDDDTLILALIGAATLEAEHLMGRALMPQKWQVSLDAFEDRIELERPPASAVDTVSYVDATTGTLTVLSSTVYQVCTGDYGASVVLGYGQAWPNTRAQDEAVQIVFSTGYANAAAVPELIKAWIKLRVGALYENREAWTVGQPIQRNPFVDGLLDRYKVWAA